MPGQDAGDPLLGQVPQRGRVRGGGELGPADLRGLGHGLLALQLSPDLSLDWSLEEVEMSTLQFAKVLCLNVKRPFSGCP